MSWTIQKRFPWESRHAPQQLSPTSQLKDFLLCYYREVLRSMGTSLLNSERLPVINLSILQSSMNLAFQSSALTSEHCILLLLHSRSPTSGPLPSLPLPPPHYRKHFTPWELWWFAPCSIWILLLKVFLRRESLAYQKHGFIGYFWDLP